MRIAEDRELFDSELSSVENNYLAWRKKSGPAVGTCGGGHVRQRCPARGPSKSALLQHYTPISCNGNLVKASKVEI